MDKLSIWKDFIANHNTNQQQFEHTGILVILHKCSIPQPIYDKMLLRIKLSQKDLIAKGYVYNSNGKIERTGRICLSKDMVAIRDWADKWDIEYSFFPKSNSGCFFAANKKTGSAYMELHTNNNNVIDAIKNFPLTDVTITTEKLLQV